MPNYGATGKVPLNMECPHCGKTGEHRIERTDPNHYIWSDEATVLFKRLVGRDISFRQRTKRCEVCKKTFISVELAKNYLGAVINAALKDQKLIAALSEKIKTAEETNQKLRSKFLRIHRFTAPEKDRT